MQISKSRPLIAVVKSNAYGLGALEVSKAIRDLVPAFAVWTTDEAAMLIAHGIKQDILVLGKCDKKCDEANVIHTVYSYDDANGIKSKRVSIKLNTGMNRLGLDKQEFQKTARTLLINKYKIYSVYTHLYCSNNPNITARQISEFDRITEGIDAYKHVAASGGLVYDFASEKYDFVRCGLAMYAGAATVLAKVICIRELKAGDHAGYGDRKLPKDAKMATVNIGYGDGYRILTGERFVFLNGQSCRVWSVCMDVTLVDVSGTDAKIGDHVEIMGDNISPSELGRSYNTNAYEVYSYHERVRKHYER